MIGIPGQQIPGIACDSISFAIMQRDKEIESGRPDEVRPQDVRHAAQDKASREAGRIAARRVSHERAGDEQKRGHREDAQIAQHHQDRPDQPRGRREAQPLARPQRQGDGMIQHHQDDSQAAQRRKLTVHVTSFLNHSAPCAEANRPAAQIVGRPLFPHDVCDHARHLLRLQVEAGCNLLDGDAALVAVPHRIQHGEGQAEEELLLGAARAIGVRSRRALLHFARDIQRRRELIHLALEEMRDRLHIYAAIAVFHEETQRMFVLVGRPHHRVVARLRVIIEHRHPRPLFEIRRRDDLVILARRHAPGLLLTLRRRHGQVEHVERVLVQQVARQRDLGGPARPELREEPQNRRIAPFVAAEPVERGRDLLGDGLHAIARRDLRCEPGAVGAGVALRQQHPKHSLRPECLRAQRKHHR